eukprot:TRINITY_DN8227_c0_g3_i1.p1 TRINITY_DN8227_c0_g3~~TRINITY_DN8227_c0_g3_i1.p1  ORF type:complete len:240 (+),score=58.91 TRINITY_DN8227_c0_g3_i1:2-721(+)
MVEPQAPYLCLLGDIGVLKKEEQYRQFLRSEAKKFKKVFVVAGNHEYYGGSITGVNEAIRKICSEEENLIFLDRTSVLLDGVRILGCTLWSFIPEEFRTEVSFSLNDFRHIKLNDTSEARLTTEEFTGFHQRDVAWLKEEISKAASANEKVVVLSHHAPLINLGCSNPQFFDSPSGTAFCTDLSSLLGGPVKVWAYGHTHWFQDQTVKGTRVVSNPHGYAYKKEGPTECPYDQKMVLNV